MSDELPTKIPSYRRHKPSGLAVVRLNGHDFYLGKHGTAASRAEYRRVIAEWLACGRRMPVPNGGNGPQMGEITVNELFLAYYAFVKTYYIKNGRPTGEQSNILDACRPLTELYGRTPVKEFGPRSLKAVRERMIQQGLCRRVINSRVNRIRRMFKWGVENELLHSSVLHALQAVAALKRYRSAARESDGVKPVADWMVEAVAKAVPAPVRAMIELQTLTGMRSGEVTIMRACDLDVSGKIWAYRPSTHKTEHHGAERVIYLGPRAQEVAKPFLKRDTIAYLFSPAEAEAERRVACHLARVTKMSCGNRPGTNRRKHPKKQPGDHYTTSSYLRAVIYGCQRAFPPPEHLRKQEGETCKQWKDRLGEEGHAELRSWRKQHSWHPHQLRHNAATRLRKEFGIEAARVVLGHRSAGITEIYAEIDHLRAADVMGRVG